MSLSSEQREKLLRQAVGLIRVHSMDVPSMIMLGTVGPLAFFLSQMLLLVQPLFGWDGAGWLSGGGAALLEEPANVDRLLTQLERGRE
ncbi:MAG: hypothetical protein GXP41_02810 [Chloroflexi bacterium]|nr:hypothetical protein [Chloroflexota bacterium]